MTVNTFFFFTVNTSFSVYSICTSNLCEKSGNNARAKDLIDKNFCRYYPSDHLNVYSDVIGGKEVMNPLKVPSGTTVTSRCKNKTYLKPHSGTSSSKCHEGTWIPDKPLSCQGVEDGDIITPFYAKHQGSFLHSADGVITMKKGYPLQLICSIKNGKKMPVWSTNAVVKYGYSSMCRLCDKQNMKFVTIRYVMYETHIEQALISYLLFTVDEDSSIMYEIREISHGNEGTYRCFKTNNEYSDVRVRVVEKFRCPEKVPWQSVGLRVQFNRRRVGSMAYFSCEKGYNLEGDESVVCNNQYLWESHNSPHCIRKCQKPDIQNDSNLRSSNVKDHYSLGERVTFSCSNNFKIKNSYQTIQCTLLGWNKDVPTCIQGCQRPNISQSSNVLISNDKEAYFVGERLRFSCQNNYKIQERYQAENVGRNKDGKVILVNSQYSKSVRRRTDSLSQDVLFSVKNGNLKPKKHILMGMSLKSLTGSKKIITLMNRMGHSLNYHAIEEIETDIAYAILDRGLNCPAGSIPGVPCGLAFDNYDELTNSLSGADTLHDTMGIMYQTQNTEATSSHDAEGPNEDVCGSQTTEIPFPSMTRKKKRRKFDASGVALAPYRKKPRMDVFSYDNKIYRDTSIDVSVSSQKLDFLWMLMHAFEMESIPMWTRFNAWNYVDHLPKQVVLYMPNIDRSPTNDDVVVETLSITQKCAEECGQPYGVVTYDLDVAKRAVKIQVAERPRFDNIFIMFGSFHLQMCLFRAIGKLIKESGMVEMLVEANVLASGSLNGFLECKNFNRCKRLHPMLALALKTLHFHQFCTTYDGMNTVTALIKDSKIDSKEARDQLCTVPSFIMLFDEYSRYTEATLDGKHGSTAKFYMQHVQRVNLYHIIDRAIRESNIDLYTFALTQATDIFFGTNRQNYARWMSKYQLDLMNITTTHPGLKEMLVAGLFSIRRTDNQFSRVPVDLTLEQTVNADAASRMTGYTDATNNFSARLRWSATKGARAALISAMLEMAGMNMTRDAQAELTPSRITRDNNDLHNLLKTIEGFANPFKLESETVVNIRTGKAATNEISDSLLSVEDKGRDKHDAFISECFDDPTRFEKAITQNYLKTFAKQGAKNRRATNQIIKELRCTRDVFGRIAIIGAKREVDLEYLLTYPLTPVPLTLCRTDGTMVTMSHGTKSDLFTHLESRIAEHGSPTKEPSIKSNEHERRGIKLSVYRITGPDQIRPRSLEKALKSTSFKQQFPRFLVKDWSQPWHYASLDGKEVYIGVDTNCYLFRGVDGVVDVSEVPRLQCNHPEADTRICLHAFDADSTCQQPGDIVVRATDTDISIILINHSHGVKSKIWMDVGTSGKDSRRYINISEIATKVGLRLCKALPGIHAFTGYDYTSFFIRKGKKRPLKIAEENDSFLDAFSALAMGEVDRSTCEALEEYTSKLYGEKKTLSLNMHRYQVFEEIVWSKEGNFVAMTWHAACNKHIPKEPKKGWELVDNSYQTVWFTCPQMPDSVVPDSTGLEDEDVDDAWPTKSNSDTENSESDIDKFD
ncbi:Complement component receptor 1-like protein [Nymphon striatum]|nr:Complement component receptor 1-like protein [Nymphon striatum]